LTNSLKPWREVIEPHPDVSKGKYHQAEFAADLAQVVYSKDAQSEYQDPEEFFKRTYVTDGIKDFLLSAIKRIKENEGDPVIQLKTSFGGGKTHTMLALYHILNSKIQGKKIENLSNVFPNGEISLHGIASAVLVGTALSATRSEIVGKIKTKTLWGNMAAQIGGEEGFALLKKDDDLGTAPGSESLIELFNKFGPCVIIIDELVRYASNIFGKTSDELNCSFDSLVTFIQNLTEAIKRTKNSLVVASIPESDIEMGGEGGKKALMIIENTFGRLEKVWKPVKPIEAFEIVRRRLFSKINDEKMRDLVCESFSDMYSKNTSKFPSESKEKDYLDRLKKSYPIHPEVFDRLYDDWSEIERFQKTRGVLRLMAEVIRELWTQNDKSLMIMPGTIPIGSSGVHAELTRYLDEQWNSVLDTDVDGERALPTKIDNENHRLGAFMAARKIARTVFMGSAPSIEIQKIRGLEDVRILLGVTQPGDPISVFEDGLSTLMNSLVHLYGEKNHYWYDTRTNLRRTVEDRASRLHHEDVISEIKKMLETRERGDFSRVQVFPESDDVLDEQEIKLVVLPLTDTYNPSNIKSKSTKEALKILNEKGSITRHFKNMIVFVCPDENLVKELEKDARQYLAWKSVDVDADNLDLKSSERKQANEFTRQTGEALKNKVHETYCWLLVPIQENSSDLNFETLKIPGNEDYALKASKKLTSTEALVVKWSPALLKRELDKWLWRNENHINTKKLWEHYTSYPYLTRLKDKTVLMDAIEKGLLSKDFFGYASEVNDDKYGGLIFASSHSSITIDDSSVLIKPGIAKIQLDLEIKSEEITDHETTPNTFSTESDSEKPKEVIKTNFYGTISVDWETLALKSGNIASEIIQHLKSLKNSNVEINIEITGKIPDGISDEVMRTISENCRTLKFKDWEFS
jgi:predicted AAA+ superfamily ATPase